MLIQNKKFLAFPVWNRCNNNCLMCTNQDWQKESNEFSFDNLIKEIDLKLKGENLDVINITEISLTGGEPTIRPDFFRLLDYLANKFLQAKINLLSNGRMFSYDVFAKKCFSKYDLNFFISFLAPNVEIFDKITQVKGSFNQAVAGIKNILKYRQMGQEIELRVVISKLNYLYIEEILSFIANNFPDVDRVIIIFMEYEGQAQKNLDVLKLKYSELSKKLLVIQNFKSKLKNIRLYHFPLCVLDKSLWADTWRTLPAYELMFEANCDECLYKKYCLGIHKDYAAIIGTQEFSPIKQNCDIIEGNNFYHPILGINNK